MRNVFRFVVLYAAVGVAASVGCGSGKADVKDRQFTDEEIAKQKAEDAAVETEESQGKRKDGKKQK